jgi:hypothetical protein
VIGRLILTGIVGLVLISAFVGLMDPTSHNKTASADTAPGVTVVVETPASQGQPAAPDATATPVVANRANCDQIRGTNYNSPDERQWFLANCVVH